MNKVKKFVEKIAPTHYNRKILIMSIKLTDQQYSNLCVAFNFNNCEFQ